ncbi:GPALPP motifs-containing protein 1 [Eumeta japonica]|uniref:GPALPP motifs-containing protein 1 n=1 Tax=Eumeta variegata TaxID=151549 RepID=A0A4C1U9X8_EUMVA|nr:GPALPP motifs-containing protein 1 [Eumeta japonica]
MISDESSSDSETGRFKCHTKKKDDQHALKKDSDFKSSNRSIRGVRSRNDRVQRDYERRKDERQRYERRSRERHRSSRYSPISRRKHSTDRNLGNSRRTPELRHKRSSPSRDHRSRDNRSCSRDKKKHSRSLSQKKIETSKNTIDLRNSLGDTTLSFKPAENETRKRRSASSDCKIKMSQVHIPEPILKKDSPIHILEEVESDKSEGIQPASYYNMIPIVKDKSEASSVTDSSDDEKLRAKLLNLEKELRKTRKKKHKKKHKKKSSKIKAKEKDKDTSTSVEVSSTTDIQEKKDDNTNFSQLDVEVSSTQAKSNKKDTSEEGEISSDDSNKNQLNIEPSDLRHKLKRSVQTVARSVSPDLREKLKAKQDVCGPALPPHLEKKFKRSISSDIEEVEGPVLPPHLMVERNIGPSIPTEMRKVLADADHTVIKNESSDEEGGIGPIPVDSIDITSEAQLQLEERALSMKIKQLEGHTLQNTDIKTREKWMLELPEAKAKYLGLEARTFRAKEGPDLSDRSCWTDTPEQRAQKEAGLPPEGDSSINLEQEAKAKHIAERDAEYEKAVKKHKKKHKREESLLDMHQKKLKKKKKKAIGISVMSRRRHTSNIGRSTRSAKIMLFSTGRESSEKREARLTRIEKEEKEDGKAERRPFNRETDLQVNRFDEAQKKAIIKKAQNLDSRFSSGEAKYL